jgi:hypothetical protein
MTKAIARAFAPVMELEDVEWVFFFAGNFDEVPCSALLYCFYVSKCDVGGKGSFL